MLTQIRTCKLFHLVSLNLDTEQVHQLILLQEDPAITRMSSKLNHCVDTHTKEGKQKDDNKRGNQHEDNKGESSKDR